MTNTTPSGADALRALIREAGGIVHSDGNIFFTNADQFMAAVRAALSAAQEAPAEEVEALNDMLGDARQQLDMLREALGVTVEPHQSLFERMMDAARGAQEAPAQAVQAVPEGFACVPVDALRLAVEFAVPAMQRARDSASNSSSWMVDVVDKNISKVSALLASAPAAPQPAGQQIDWKGQYEKQKRRAEMWIAKYEKDVGPLEKVVPAAQGHPVAAVLADLLRDALGPLEVSAAVIESDDTEQMADLIRRIKIALNQWDADRAAQQKGGATIGEKMK